MSEVFEVKWKFMQEEHTICIAQETVDAIDKFFEQERLVEYGAYISVCRAAKKFGNDMLAAYSRLPQAKYTW